MWSRPYLSYFFSTQVLGKNNVFWICMYKLWKPFLFSIFPSTTSIFFLWWQLKKNINALSWQVRTAIWWKYEIGSVVTTFGHLIKSHYYLGMLLYRVKRFWSILTMIRGANILSSQPTCFFCSYLRLLFRTGVGRLQTKCANKIVHIILLA